MALRKSFEEARRKGETKQNKAVLVLFKHVQWLCIESIPLVKFKSLLDLLHDLGLRTAILKQTNISYDSYTTSDDILQCLPDVIDDELKEKLEKSPIVTALADESTNIANHKRLALYTQIISEDMKPSTHFVTNIEFQDATGKGIADAVLAKFGKRGVQPKKIMSLGSDGASVMAGKEKGLFSSIFALLVFGSHFLL